ncbi:TVP38/TMEM64 family protein [Pacificibacter maritimus]|uniref:TVP38/TMEM64 family protein n=1 Tax=Pacificibacter maritimus TaxID=762213 RepID=UPI001FE602D8|nr:TVP38/TMEM64 family protein [Pacificibacter maritimus]
MPLALFVALAIALAVVFRDSLSFEALAQNRETLIAYRDSHYFAAVAVFIALYIAVVTFSLPGATVATLAGGFLFGAFPGVLFNVAGATIGASCLFLAVRWGLGEWLAAKMDASSGRIKQVKDSIDTNQWPMLFLIRLLPILPFFVANLLPAFVGVPLRRFVISTGIGIIPGTLVITSIGSGLGSVLDEGGAPDLGVFFEPRILLPLLGLAALSAAPIVYKRYKSNLGGSYEKD